jgi:hypothetical protein
VARNFIGWDPNASKAISTYNFTEQAGTSVAALTPGMMVRVSSGVLAGNTYEYVGPETNDSDPTTAGNQPFDLSAQNYSDTSKWQQVLDSTRQVGTLIDALTPGMTVYISSGTLARQLYEYVGAATDDSNPTLTGKQPFDLSTQTYSNTALWRQLYDSTYKDGEGQQVGTTVASLTPGMQVRIASGALKGNVFKYKGELLTDSDLDMAGNQPFDLSLQSYGDDTLWEPVNVITSERLGGALVDALTPGMKVRIASGALVNDIYEYVGPSMTDSDPNTGGNQKFDLSVQQYRDATLWKQVNVGTNAAQVRAYIANSSVRATGALTIDAKSTASIDATVVAAALGVGGGSTGVAVSVTGSYSENRIKTDVKAYIDGAANTATNGIEALSVALHAEDGSSINAVAGAASIAAGFGASAGVAVAAGLSLAFNEVSNNVEAHISGMDKGVTTSSGSITISALSGGEHLFDLDLTGILNPDNLDDAATADLDNPDDPANEPVATIKTHDDLDTPDIDETEYKYTGGDDVTSRFDDAINEAWVDAEGDRLVLEALRQAFAARGLTLAMFDIVGTAAQFRTGNGVQDVREGTTVQLQKGYTAGMETEYDGRKGIEGRVYRYIVMAPEDSRSYETYGSKTYPTPNLIDLSAQDYTDTTKWQLVDKLKVAVLVEGRKWALVAPDGKAYIL